MNIGQDGFRCTLKVFQQQSAFPAPSSSTVVLQVYTEEALGYLSMILVVVMSVTAYLHPI